MAGAKRLFFALWPDDRVRDLLREWQKKLLPKHVRVTHREDLHMTLHFLGQVNPEQVEALFCLGREVAGRAFELELDHLGHFRRARVLWAGVERQPAGLRELHQAIEGRLPGLGFEPEQRTFRPHVTLARKVNTKPETMPPRPVCWQVRRWALVESRPGQVPLYQPLAVWPLQENGGKQKENKLHSSAS